MPTEPYGSSTSPLRERLRHAIEAERDTGAREDTDREAKRHIFVRIGIILVGTIVLIAGLAMLLLPGPGIVAVLAGLGILAQSCRGPSASWSG